MADRRRLIPGVEELVYRAGLPPSSSSRAPCAEVCTASEPKTGRRIPVSPVALDKERLAFLQHAQNARPDLLRELHALLPMWRSAHDPQCGRLLYQWAEKFHLQTRWALRFARGRMRHWSLEERRRRPAVMEWSLAGHVIVFHEPDIEPLRLAFLWEASVETAAQFEARAVEETRHAAHEFILAVSPRLGGLLDWRPKPETRKREADGLKWLAQFQVGGWTYAQVRRDNRLLLHPSAIPKAIRSAASRIELPLRPKS